MITTSARAAFVQAFRTGTIGRRVRGLMNTSFKAVEYLDRFWSPNGLYVVIREHIGKPGYSVRVLNFATWKHREFTYPDAATALREAALWRI